MASKAVRGRPSKSFGCKPSRGAHRTVPSSWRVDELMWPDRSLRFKVEVAVIQGSVRRWGSPDGEYSSITELIVERSHSCRSIDCHRRISGAAHAWVLLAAGLLAVRILGPGLPGWLGRRLPVVKHLVENPVVQQLS